MEPHEEQILRQPVELLVENMKNPRLDEVQRREQSLFGPRPLSEASAKRVLVLQRSGQISEVTVQSLVEEFFAILRVQVLLCCRGW